MDKKRQGKRIFNQELAKRFNRSRATILAYIEAFNQAGNTYNPRDIDSVLDFYDYLCEKRDAKIGALQGRKA